MLPQKRVTRRGSDDLARCTSYPDPGCATSRVIIPVRIATTPNGIPELTRITTNFGRIQISVTNLWTRIPEGCATSQNGPGRYRFLESVRIPSADNSEDLYMPLDDPRELPSHPLNTAPHQYSRSQPDTRRHNPNC
jgi:hypothetical protein